MNQNIWGKCTWVLMHSIAVNYPINPTVKEKENVYKFFSTLGDILPCKYCREHYKKNLKEMPIMAETKMDLIWWTIDLHNKVNILTNKKVISRKEALIKIMSMYKKHKDNPEGIQFVYIGILLIFIITIQWFIMNRVIEK